MAIHARLAVNFVLMCSHFVDFLEVKESLGYACNFTRFVKDGTPSSTTCFVPLLLQSNSMLLGYQRTMLMVTLEVAVLWWDYACTQRATRPPSSPRSFSDGHTIAASLSSILCCPHLRASALFFNFEKMERTYADGSSLMDFLQCRFHLHLPQPLDSFLDKFRGIF
eukprot:4941127-Amphidinium_carterae.2